MKKLDPKCLPSLLQFVMDRQLETGAIDCQEAEETRDHIVRLLEEEANKENKTFILFPDKEQMNYRKRLTPTLINRPRSIGTMFLKNALMSTSCLSSSRC